MLSLNLLSLISELQESRLYGHQGGWDEVLLVALPLLFLLALVILSTKRLSKTQSGSDQLVSDVPRSDLNNSQTTQEDS